MSTQECGRCFETHDDSELGEYVSKQICEACLYEIEDDLKKGITEPWYEDNE